MTPESEWREAFDAWCAANPSEWPARKYQERGFKAGFLAARPSRTSVEARQRLESAYNATPQGKMVLVRRDDLWEFLSLIFPQTEGEKT